MSDGSKIKELIRSIAKGRQVTIFTAEVVAVDDQHCDVVYAGTTLTKVKHFCIDDAGSLLIKPKIKSMVTVAGYDDLRDLQILKVQDIDKIIFNNGSNHGLVNIADLTSKLNNLVAEIKALKTSLDIHVHVGVTTGIGTSGTSVITGNFSDFNQSNYEDTNFKH